MKCIRILKPIEHNGEFVLHIPEYVELLKLTRGLRPIVESAGGNLFYMTNRKKGK